MRSNGLLKWLMIPMALLVVFVGFKLFSGGGSQTSGDGGPQLTPEEARALGIEGDTPRDTVATLVGLVRQLRGELQTALGDNRTQKAENERLRAREGSIDRRIQSALKNERNLMRQDRDQVAGERRSNAQQYLGSQALITAAGAGAASLIKSDNGSVAVVANNSGSLGTVGISGNEAMGRILAGGVRDMADWVNKLYGQAFAAVYVQPGARVAVHLEQPLDIDYDAKGRRVHHRTGEAHASDLD